MKSVITMGNSFRIIILLMAGILSCCSTQDKSGSDHFNGKTYYNINEDSGHKFAGMIKWLWEMKTIDWPEWIDDPAQPKPEPHAVRAHILLRSEQSMGMHYATFNEHPEQAVDAHEKDLAKALKDYRLPAASFRILKFGEGLTVKLNK